MTANITALDMFNILRQKIGEQEANTLTEYVTAEVERKFDNQKDNLVTKEDLAALGTSLRKEIADLRVEVREQKSEMIKWMFIFWIGQIGATIGLFVLFFKK